MQPTNNHYNYDTQFSRAQERRNQRVYRKAALRALNQELKSLGMIQNVPNPTKSQLWKDNFYAKAAERARVDALENFLSMFCISRRLDLEDEHPLPDEDRVAVYQAMCSKIPQKYIQMMLRDYPRACESGGCVDHINHPIHAACTYHREAVHYILDLYPGSADQPNEDGKMPFELFIENEDMIDISSEAFVATVNRFTKLNPTRSREIFSGSRNSLKDQIMSTCVVPSHLHRQSSHSSGTTSHDNESLDNTCIDRAASRS